MSARWPMVVGCEAWQLDRMGTWVGCVGERVGELSYGETPTLVETT